MPKSSKVKNPCKICLRPVTQKKGIKCQGICQHWVHYSCLNYTPGKISDIKKGLFKVTCPCPECKTTPPKELKTNVPLICDNHMCPANGPIQCHNNKCPANVQYSEKMTQTSHVKPSSPCTNVRKQHNSPTMLHKNPKPQYQSRAPGEPNPLLPRCPVCHTCCPSENLQQANHKQIIPRASISDTTLDMYACPSVCTNSSSDIPADIGTAYTTVDDMNSISGFDQMCAALGQLTYQINELMGKMKQVILEKHGEGLPQSPKTNSSPKGPRPRCLKCCDYSGNTSRGK